MKKIFLSPLVVFLCSLFALSNNKVQAVTLVQDGKPAAQIVISTNASSTEKYVAEDLQRIITKISGAKLSIVNQIPESTFAIVIGTPQSVPAIKSVDLLKTENPETVRVATRGKVLFLTGNTPGSALRAVYTFLQEDLNCRWYWPGESGEYLPSMKTISIADLDVSETPDIRDRTISLTWRHWDEVTLDWMSRNRMNWYYLDRWRITNERIVEIHQKGLQAALGGHSIILPAEILKAHPEYRALYAGKRQGGQLCWGNPGVQDAVAEEIENWWEKYPNLDSIDLMAADTMHYCQDDLCKVLAPDVSTRWQKFCGILINKANQKYPGKEYRMLAYQSYGELPTEATKFDLISYAVLYRDYTKPITAASNDKERENLQAWKAIGGNVGIRGYQFIPFREELYAPFAPLIVQDLAWAHQMGLKGWRSEESPYGYDEKMPPQDQRWNTNRMSLYAVAQAMWNADVDASAITQDWTKRIFGVSSAPMLDYYTSMQKAWANSPEPLRHFANVPAAFVSNFISKDLLIKAKHYFQAARTKLNVESNAKDKARILQQINLESAMLDNWRKVYLLQQGLPPRFKAEAPKVTIIPQVTAATDDPAWKNIPSLPGFENINLQSATDVTKVLMQWDKEALYLRFVNHGADIKDDEIELLLSDPAETSQYYRIEINAKNGRHNAKIVSGMNADTSWNPQYISKTLVDSNSWILDVKLPFKEFGIAAKEDATWKMSFKRNNMTGWPDASNYNPTAFGTVTLVDKIAQPKRIVFYNAEDIKNDALLVTFRKTDFTARAVTQAGLDDKSTFADGVDAIVLSLPPSIKGVGALDTAMKRTVVPFVEKGGLLLITGHSNYPLGKWFGADAAVKWSDLRADGNRKSTFVKPGKWQTVPNDLSEVLKKVTTPLYGYKPLSDKWDVMAKMSMVDGSESAYMLRLKIGKGNVILTSSSFGYGGGWEMFGDRRIENCPKLMENLLLQLNSKSP